MTYGGLPAIALMKTEEQKVNYLKTQIKNVYLKDIVERNHLFSDENIEELLSVIASGIASLTNPSKLANTFKSVKKSTISANTINSYINYMQDAFILSKVNRYDLKGKKYINSPICSSSSFSMFINILGTSPETCAFIVPSIAFLFT